MTGKSFSQRNKVASNQLIESFDESVELFDNLSKIQNLRITAKQTNHIRN